MKIIKLDAIDSTNSFLKNMTAKTKVDDFTVVVARNQTSGRGQMNTQWESETGKALTFSVFCRFSNLLIKNHKYLNYCVSLSVFETINSLEIPKLAIKWPNDIMSVNKKIAGILIENTLNSNNIAATIIGVGINVNQDSFSDDLPNATSLKMILDKEIDLDLLMNRFFKILQEKIEILKAKKYASLEIAYLNVLYKKNVPSMFKNNQNTLFMGKIIGISDNGNIQIELDDETVKDFGLKEISFA